jgi:hypothetical protein
VCAKCAEGQTYAPKCAVRQTCAPNAPCAPNARSQKPPTRTHFLSQKALDHDPPGGTLGNRPPQIESRRQNLPHHGKNAPKVRLRRKCAMRQTYAPNADAFGAHVWRTDPKMRVCTKGAHAHWAHTFVLRRIWRTRIATLLTINPPPIRCSVTPLLPLTRAFGARVWRTAHFRRTCAFLAHTRTRWRILAHTNSHPDGEGGGSGTALAGGVAAVRK